MKHRIVGLVLIVAVTFVIAAGAVSGWFTNAWEKTPEQTGVVKYEKPSIGELAQDGAYPEEIQSEITAADWEKEWYEYVVYNQKPFKEHQNGNKKIAFYDPYDYNYGMVTEITGTAYDGLLDEEGFTTANAINVSYTTESSLSVSEGISTTIETGVEVSGDALFAEVKTSVSASMGVSMDISASVSSAEQKSVDYNAVYFNSNGAPYRWRVVKYAVFIPIYCEYMELVNGKWVVADSGYCLVATVQGTCREWIEDGVAYYEDWKTGEPIAVENFWKEYMTAEALLLAVAGEQNLIPEMIKPYLPPIKDIDG